MSLRPAHRAASLAPIGALVVLLASVLPAAAADRQPQIAVIPAGSAYREKHLASDAPGMALVQDPLLVNPWGIAMTPTGPFWVADDGTSTARSLDASATTPLVPSTLVTIPGGLPTGAVANPLSSGFGVSAGGKSGSARLLYASITGNLIGWHFNVPTNSTSAQIGASHPGHVYTGLAIASTASGTRLYAADFANGAIDVYGPDWSLLTSSAFADPTIPTTAGNTYHPYNIQAIGGSLYVTYAKVAGDGQAEAGVGNGFVRRFNTDGVRDLTFGINNGALNSPWGATIAPASFGIFGGALLIGNNTDGNPSLHAYNPTTGAFLGTLQDESGNGIVIDRLFGLSFGNGGRAGNVNTLYYASGLGEQEHGIFGSLTPTTASATSTVQFSTDEYVIGEGSKVIQVTVTRSGDASGTASVRYATWDQSQVGHASQKSDYTLNIGSLEFGAGQTSKSFSIRIINDKFDENDEDIDLALSNPSGAGLGLGSPAVAHVRITDNDTGAPSSNPLDGTAFFVRQQYLDFFGREPDVSRLAYWSGIIDACGSNTTCRRNQRNSVSSQLLQSTESLDTSGTILRMSRAVFGKDPLYGDVAFFSQQLRSRGASAMATAFLAQPTAVVAVGSLGHTALVNKLTANSGYAFSTATKNGWISRLNAATLTRAGLLLELSKATGYVSSVRNRWVVLAGYWGYLRRDPDTAGFNTRLNQLIAGGGAPIASGLIDGFVRGAEYRQRFGPS